MPCLSVSFFVVNISTGLIDAVLTVALSVYVIRQFNTTTAPKQQRNDTEFEPPECRVWPWIRDKRSSFYVAYHQTFNPDYAKNRGPATGTGSDMGKFEEVKHQQYS